MEYMTINEAAEKWGANIRQICSWCNQGKIDGAFKKQIWFIPQYAEKPIVKRGKKKKEFHNKK